MIVLGLSKIIRFAFNSFSNLSVCLGTILLVRSLQLSGKSLWAQIQHALNMVNHDLFISKSLLLGNIQNPAPSPFPKLLEDIVDDSPPLKLQHYFTKARSSFIYDRLFTETGVERKAHILSQTHPHAADILKAPATSHTKQPNPEISVSLYLYLYQDLQRFLGLQPGKKQMCPYLQSTLISSANSYLVLVMLSIIVTMVLLLSFTIPFCMQ